MSKRMIRVLEQVTFLLFIVCIWQFISYIGVDIMGWWKSYSVPTPFGVFASLKSLLNQNALLPAIGYSMVRCISGFSIAVFLGFIVGILIHRFKFLGRNLKPIILGIQTLPSICWVPFAILWFGLDNSAVLFVVVMGSAFSFSIAVDSAIRGINPIYLKVAQTMGTNKRDTYLHVVIPASLPGFVSGLKQTWSFAWRALMSGEVMVTCIGLGYTLILGRELADINQVALVMIVIILLGVLVDKFVFSVIEKSILKRRGL